MEKMEVENSNDTSIAIETPIRDDVVVAEALESPKGTKWIRNQAEATKRCESCGAIMRGWAYREPFQYCPKCGALAEKAE